MDHGQDLGGWGRVKVKVPAFIHFHNDKWGGGGIFLAYRPKCSYTTSIGDMATTLSYQLDRCYEEQEI